MHYLFRDRTKIEASSKNTFSAQNRDLSKMIMTPDVRIDWMQCALYWTVAKTAT